MSTTDIIDRLSDTIWELPVDFKKGMLVPARIYGTEKLIRKMDKTVYDQITNVSTLPGVTRYSCCMPDGHFGYGFPIGGVAAMDVAEGGVISPGGIGFDINCGMRLITTNLTYEEVKPRIPKLVDLLYQKIPAGVGSRGPLTLSKIEFCEFLEEGANWCVRHGYGWEEDLEFTEEEGCMKGADVSKISERSVLRGYNQVGSLGSGNHYLEIQVARPEGIFNRRVAEIFGITIPNQIVVMVHCGSRGFGHQVATDYLRTFLGVMRKKYGIRTLDRELACVPFDSPEGQDYFAAMKCAANMSFVNRQIILHHIREIFSQVFSRSAEDMRMQMVYDVSHNIAKLENHEVDGGTKKLLVHRKGATRAFGPGLEGIPRRFKKVGQPVIIGGSMESGSYLLAGVAGGEETFFSTAHGSGRTMSRTKARKRWSGEKIQRELRQRGIYVRSTSLKGLAEEAGGAYKNIEEVVDATEQAGISKRIVRFTPIGNIKG